MKVTKEQAKGFLEAIRPCGHMSNIDTPMSHYFTGIIGQIPQHLPYKSSFYGTFEVDTAHEKMADVLRQIANHLTPPQQKDNENE